MAVLTGAIEAEGEAVAVTATDAGAATGTVMIVAQGAIITGVEAVLAQDLAHLMTRDIIVQMTGPDETIVMMTDHPAGIATVEDVAEVEGAAVARQKKILMKMSVISVLSSFSSWLLV